MLTELTIRNLAIIHKATLSFTAQFTIVTGETGAGKSIVLDALLLCLGARAASHIVRPGATNTHISAQFNLIKTPNAAAWLKQYLLDDIDTNNQSCFLTRVISADGGSRAFINGHPATIAQLRQLGQQLVQIHGQHANEQLLKPFYQKQLLDSYAGHETLLKEMRASYRCWQEKKEAVIEYEKNLLVAEARQALLNYYLQELDFFLPQIGEYEKLEVEHKRLAYAQDLRTISEQVLQLLSTDKNTNIITLLSKAQQKITTLQVIDKQLSNVKNILAEALLQVNEAYLELQAYLNQLAIDPNRFIKVEKRLSQQCALAKKHLISPAKLPNFYQQLQQEKKSYQDQQNRLNELQQQEYQYKQQAEAISIQLHQQRCQVSHALAMSMVDNIKKLAMPQTQFEIKLDFNLDKISEEGATQVLFLLSTNPGQPLQPLAKIASGGELSRIALALQLILADKMQTSTLVFDEIDTGISGATAITVGRLLRRLAEKTQIISVTHLPQIAGCAHTQFVITKQLATNTTKTEIKKLDQEARLHEIARLLGGEHITKNTLANAKELLMLNTK